MSSLSSRTDLSRLAHAQVSLTVHLSNSVRLWTRADCHVCLAVFEKRPTIHLADHSPDSHFGWEMAEKSPEPQTRISRRNSLYNSKAEIHLGMSEFDPSQGSQPVPVLATVCNLRLTGPENPGFSGIRLCLQAPDLSITGAKWTKISGSIRKNSRFTEIIGGD